MSLKDLFNENKNLKSLEPITKEDFKDETESFDYSEAILKRDQRFIAIENFDDPSVFARFGSAEKYYEDAITNIYNSYPYDGSLKEKTLWEVSASLVDLYIYENGYPRTTGYVIFSTTNSTAIDTSDGYGAAGTSSYEYILTKGGPHAGTGASLHYNSIENEVVYRKNANIYDLSENRESNLLIDGNKGNTVEFWLKKTAFDPTATEKEVIFDVYTTSSISSSADYGRLRIEMSGHGAGSSATSPFYITYMSGTSGFANENIGSSVTTTSIADDQWHHYAFRFKNTGSNVITDLFIDGEHNHSIQTGTTVDYISGALVSTIGALATHPSGTAAGAPQATLGWGKLSGSVDEFRYWKTFRTSKKIQRYWFDQVGGGTNTDTSNTDLGVYYKFNEGITGDTSLDSTVLDYSGRVSNGAWTGYASGLRNVGSAIDESTSTNFSGSEFKDPIIYSSNPEVETYLSNMRGSGSVYDDTNPNSLISYIPSWIIEQNETDNDLKDKNYLWNLLQIISSYFDEAAILLEKLPQLSHKKYYSGVANPPPFNIKALESHGFIVPDIFINSDILEKFEDRDDKIKFESTLQEIKNTIYQNIYNNLNYIYKTKGTEKAFRNLFHCFGFGDNTLKFNIYGDNSTYELEDNLKFTSKIKNYINFNEISNSDASVYQYQIDSNSTSFISGTSETDGTFEGAGLSFTLESNVVLPNRVRIDEYHTVKEHFEDKVSNFYPLIVNSSLFGLHSAIETENDLTWAADDYASFQVYTVKDDKFSSNAYFKLTSTDGGFVPELTSSLLEDVYDDQLWTVSVTVEPTKYPLTNQVSGTDNSDYTVRFYGVNYIADYKAQEFLVTGTMTNDEGRKFLSSRKRVYTGAHRTNFTGSLLDFSDVKVNSCKAWMTSIPTGTIDNHNLKIGNYGAESPTENAYLYQDSINGINVPQAQTLALMWDFTTVTGSDANGQFWVEDETSGSATDSRFGWLSDVVSRRHTASGSFFDTSSTNVVQSLDRSTYQTQVPEVLLDSNLTRILTEDDEFFNRNTRPTTYHLSIEKNMFQDISEEMLNMFGSVVWFNNMIGNPVNVYRGEYKELKKAADLFFEKVGNDYDFDKYVEYFKFIDHAVTDYVVKLIPASMMTFEDGISTIIENFALGDRDKFASKYPLIKDVKPREIVGEALGINEQLYDWKRGHAPISNEQDDNCLWWKERAARDNTVITSGDTSIDTDRQQVLDTANNETNASAPTLYDNDTSTTYEGSTYVTRRLAKPYKVKGVNQPELHGGSNSYQNKKVGFWDAIRQRPIPSGAPEGAIITIEPPDSSLDSFQDCDDNLEISNLKGKRKYNFSAQTSIDGNEFSADDKYKGDLVFPFSLYSSSVADDPSRGNVADFQTNLNITNIHQDSYGPFNDVPMQGPFTEKYVGGRPYRHVFTSFTPNETSLDEEGERLEGWILSGSADKLDLKNPNSPKSVYFRDGVAKRPVNIANIQQTTGASDTDDKYIHPANATVIGNYSKAYEIVMTNGRSINNRYLAESDGVLPTATTDNFYISGAVDFALPRRDLTGSNQYIIVNRFNAPGSPATMGEGMLDVAAAEYSVYNALPWRNLSVRQPLDELLRDHCKQFGYFSDAFNSSSYVLAGVTYPGTSGSVNALNYEGSASFQKTNRNTRKILRYVDEYTGPAGTVITSSRHDNAFITHAIPQSDMQYAWITGNTENEIIGYEAKGLDRGDFASSDIEFVSSSGISTQLIQNSITTAVYVQHPSASLPAGFIVYEEGPNFDNNLSAINTSFYEPLSSSINTLGYPLESSIRTYGNPIFNDFADRDWDYAIPGANYVEEEKMLNGLLLQRQGPWGGANWKLYKKDNHPIVRYQKNNNIIGYLFNDKGSITGSNQETIKNFREPAVTSKYKPLLYSTPSSTPGDIAKTIVSLGNLRAHFTDHTKELKSSEQYSNASLNELLPVGKSKENIKLITYSPYAAFKKYLDETTDSKTVQVSYTESIYPKELYTYLSGTRKRINFTNDFWRDDRDDRTASDYDNSTGNNIDIASIWKLDAHTNFVSDYINIPYSGGMPTEDGVGELQNCYSLFHYAASAGGGSRSDIIPAVNYNRRIKLIANNYVIYLTSPAGPRSTSVDFVSARHTFITSQMPTFSDLTDAASPARMSASVGDTLWAASSSTGDKPFYDSYDEYAEEGFRNLKDGTILPEFIISDKIDDYLDAGAEMNYNTYKPASFFNLQDLTANSKIENGLLSLTGSSIVDPKADASEFLQRYAFSDFYKYFSLVKSDYDQTETTPQHKLVCEAILKFLPYEGFYPSERCLQMGTLFSQSLNKILTGDDANLRTAMQPYFAPGILFNSIKSGIAVDYPIFTDASSFSVTSSLVWGNCLTGNFDQRIKIEELLQPKQRTIIDAEVDLDLNLNSSASVQYANSPYTFAMSNFLAETMDTFISEKNYSSIASEPFDLSENISTARNIGEYTLDIILRNSTNITTDSDFETAKVNMIDRIPGANAITNGFPFITSSLQVNTPSIDMYNRAITGFNIDPFIYGSSFGPPVHSGEFATGSFIPMTTPNKYGGTTIDGTTFDPFTPSYYNGYSRVRLTYNSDGNDTDLQTVLSELTYSYDRLRTFQYPVYPPGTSGEILIADALAAAEDTTAYKHSMQISASLYLGAENINNIIYENTTIEGGTSTTKQIISFKPRWECPVLDFSDIAPAESYVSGNVARGMWHQYGEKPSSRLNEGIVLDVQHNSGFNLADLLKINTNQNDYIGRLNNKETFSEAIVVIPFKYKNNTQETEVYNMNMNETGLILQNLYFDKKDELDPLAPVRSFEATSNRVSALTNAQVKIDENLYNLIAMMRKYVMPPHLDWVHNTVVRPYTMFMIEYEVDLNSDDLQNIWQNIEPTFAKKALKVTSESNSHLLPTDDMKSIYFNHDPFKDSETRWAVFKVKKRAKSNYNSIVGKTNFGGKDYTRQDLTDNTNDFLYSYNWPYDFFSLIELAKINSITTFNPIYNDDEEE